MGGFFIVMGVALAVALLIAFLNRPPRVTVEPEREDPTLADLFALLNRFLDVVGNTLWSTSGGKRYLDSKQEKLRCLYFTFGAIKRLAETLQDQEFGTSFAGMASVQEAAYWFGQDKAMDLIRDYGCRVNIPDPEVLTPAEAGYSLMERFMAGQTSDMYDGYSALNNELLLVVRGASWEEARAISLPSDRHDDVNDLQRSFESFLALLGTTNRQKPDNALAATEEEKHRYLYFMFGASHRLALTASNDESAGGFYRSMTAKISTELFGAQKGERKILEHLQHLANPENAPHSFFAILETGHSTMEHYLTGIEGFRQETVVHILQTRFREAVYGEDPPDAGV